MSTTAVHAPILESRLVAWPDEAACQRWAAALAGKPALADAVIELHGVLGAGKTTFVRHLLRALGVQGRIKSPTYAVLETYEVSGVVPMPVLHFDCYRFSDPREWLDAGFRELFAAPGLKLVEWPDNAAPFLPPPDLRLHIAVQAADEQRSVTAQALTPRGCALLA